MAEQQAANHAPQCLRAVHSLAQWVSCALALGTRLRAARPLAFLAAALGLATFALLRSGPRRRPARQQMPERLALLAQHLRQVRGRQASADEQNGAGGPDRKRAEVAKPKAAAKKANGRAARKRVPSAKAQETHCAGEKST